MQIEDITPEYLRQEGIEPDGLMFSKNHLPYNPRLKDFSRQLRQGGIMAEALLWKQLKARQIGFQFNRQKPILNYIADFYCKEVGVVVEIDGSSHDTPEAQLKDKERDRQMRVIGLEIIRVSDRDVLRDAVRVAEFIMEECEKRRVRVVE